VAVKCTICDYAKDWVAVNVYDQPDKYEKWLEINQVHRSWVKCLKCGFHQQIRNYPLWQLEHIYKDGYRSVEFRGETIQHAFKRIMAIENNENESRYIWFAMNTRHSEAEKVLDIGSGIGVWPALLKKAEYDVTCVEENEHSVDFIYDELGLPCYEGLKSVTGEFDTVSLIHVLEHIEEPDNFLQVAKEHLRKNGFLFIEVPDAIEFDYLPEEHDEFNSTHVSFFDTSSLYKLLDRNGFKVTDMHRVTHKQRDLSRIMCLATN
jgi:SAM-dependent methyltransferase